MQRRRRPRGGRGRLTNLLCREVLNIACHRTVLCSLLALLQTATVCAADTRSVYDADAPQWLRAVGKLQVPGSRLVDGRRTHHREDCSATLVASPNAQKADTIVTAWHCLEFYSDLSRPITFTLLPGSPGSIETEVRRLADGGGMYADWALLRLQTPVARGTVVALPIDPQRADPTRPITLAGYSRDPGLGNNGSALTYDANCQITLQQRISSNTDCTAYKGASGGAVVQLGSEGEAWLSGVVSRGNSDGVSIYVPVAGFRSAILRYLN